MQGTHLLGIGRKRSVTLFAAGLAVLLAVTPLASAMGYGVANSGVNEAKSSGWTPAYGQFWIGKWSNGNWDYLEQQLNLAKQNGATPVIEWYYWGDAITPNCVQYGCQGMSQGEWWSMGDTLSKKVRSIMGDRPVIIVLETEFNKGGVQNWEAWDGMMADHITMLKRNAPNAKVAVGFGAWDYHNFQKFDRAMAKADYAGIQLMRGITRDGWNEYWNAADETVGASRALRDAFGKPIIVHDIALSSYNAGSAQKNVIDQLNAKKGTLESYGVFALVYRDLRDYKDACSCWYYGEAEKHFGLKTHWGDGKSAWWSWVNMAKTGSSSSPPSGGSTGGGGSGSSSPDAQFSPKAGNNWWIQVGVSGNPNRVVASVNNGAWFDLDKQSYGWTKSQYVPNGGTVKFRAHMPDGSLDYSTTYRWSDGTAVGGSTGSGSGSGSGSSGGSSSDVTFKPKTGGEWWIQVDTDPDAWWMQARINGGGWFNLEKQSYGWTKSVHVPQGATVQFKAKMPGNVWVTSEVIRWHGTSGGGSSGGSSSNGDVQWNVKEGNNWWIQADTNPDAWWMQYRVNGGNWINMDQKSYGWTKSAHVPDGARVQFKAKVPGDTWVVSQVYVW